MGMPTIKNANNVTFTFQDGDVEEATSDKDANLDSNPTPGTDSDQTYIVDFNGVMRTIVITGKLTLAQSTRTDSGSTTTIAEQIAWLEALEDGNQIGAVLNTSYYIDLNVFIKRVHTAEKQGEANFLEYSITMIEGE